MRENIEQVLDFMEPVDEMFEESKGKSFTYGELDTYFNIYEEKGLNKRIADSIRKENPLGTTAYDLSYRLTQLCQDPKLADVTRGRIEHLAGEVVLSYENILDHVRDEIIRKKDEEIDGIGIIQNN